MGNTKHGPLRSAVAVASLATLAPVSLRVSHVVEKNSLQRTLVTNPTAECHRKRLRNHMAALMLLLMKTKQHSHIFHPKM